MKLIELRINLLFVDYRKNCAAMWIATQVIKARILKSKKGKTFQKNFSNSRLYSN